MAAKVCWSYFARTKLLLNPVQFKSIRVLFGQRSLFRCLTTLNGESLSSQENTNTTTSDTVPLSQDTTDYKSKVHPGIAEILEKSRPKLVGNNWHKPKLSARRVAVLRKKYIAQGYYWPERPLVDRGMDKTPKGHKYEREKEEKLARIEENMKNMPKIIEEYRKRMRELRAKRKEEKRISSIKSLEAKRLGIHPKDPRALTGLGQNPGPKSKAKFKKK